MDLDIFVIRLILVPNLKWQQIVIHYYTVYVNKNYTLM